MAELIARRGWRVGAGNPGRIAAVDVLASWQRTSGRAPMAGLDVYAAAVQDLARHELDQIVLRDGREAVVEGAVLGIVLGGSLLLALRAMAQEDAAKRRLG